VFAQVLRAIEDRGEQEVALEITAALASGEPIQLAVRTRATASPEVPSENLPSSLVGVEVTAGAASDYDALLGGVH
jgi:hypothetical protein